MAKRYARLEYIEHDGPVSERTHPDFWERLQHGILLALREQDELTEMEYRHASDALGRQCRAQRSGREEQD